jgi:2-isopropylmalate synthase
MAKSNNQIIIFDTTLRDGEQSPGASMSLEEKIQIARAFEDLGVDVMEAGFPAASNGDFEAVSEIAKILKKTIPCGLARAVKADIERCKDALKHAKRFRIHTFLSTSPLHMKHKLKKTPKEVLELIKDSVTLARRFTDDVEWSPEDGTRTAPDFLCKTVELAIKCGARTINIPDTVGYTIPDEYFKTIKLLFDKVPNIDKAIVSTHCHNDLGLAVANSLAGVKAGARQIECTINGIGERAGNAALEEIVMAMKTRSDLMPYKTNINTKKISSCSKLVANVTGFPVQFNKAIVGKNAFAHESGIHQDGMLKNKKTYEIMTPESVGVTKSSLVMGKHSGRNAFKDKASELGYPDLSDELINNTFAKFKDLADKKKTRF